MGIVPCLGEVDFRLLYSPSDPLGADEDERMDWSSNLDGVGNLYGDLEMLGPVDLSRGPDMEASKHADSAAAADASSQLPAVMPDSREAAAAAIAAPPRWTRTWW
jgi:hypothetical protein